MDFQSNVAMTTIKMLKPQSFSCHVHGPEMRTWEADDSILEFRFEPQGVFHLSYQFLSNVVHLCGNIGTLAKAHLLVNAGSKWTS